MASGVVSNRTIAPPGAAASASGPRMRARNAGAIGALVEAGAGAGGEVQACHEPRRFAPRRQRQQRIHADDHHQRHVGTELGAQPRQCVDR